MRNRRSSPISDCSINSNSLSSKFKQNLRESFPYSKALSPVSSRHSTTSLAAESPSLHHRIKNRRYRKSSTSSLETKLKNDSSLERESKQHSCLKKRHKTEKVDMVSSSTHSSRDSSLSSSRKLRR